MKKIILAIVLIFLLTGCSNSVTYDFSGEEINSTVEIEFNENEFINYYNNYSGEVEGIFTTDENTENMIENTYIDFSVAAYKDYDGGIVYYEPSSFEKNNEIYMYNYYFNFDYDNFVNNYYLNECFEYFTNYEDDDYYYYKLSGKITCDNINNFKIMVKSDDRTISSNSYNIKDDVHSWDIKYNDNEIFFAISKNYGKQSSNNKLLSNISIIGLILIIVLAVISFFIYKKCKNVSNY